MILYDTGIFFYKLFLNFASLFHPKAQKILAGRKNQNEILRDLEKARADKKVFWFHCASVGEFEQARPLIEKLKSEQDVFILLTFFSPSGYELRKTYEFADFVMYLPFDTEKNAKKFTEAARPEAVFFVKYEFWYHYLNVCKSRSVRVYLLSGIFRPEQRFFSKRENVFRKMLDCIDVFFVQNAESAALLSGIGKSNVVVTGDTRFDRVWQIKNGNRRVATAEIFSGGEAVFVAGSVWAEDIQLLQKVNLEMKKIIAPHEISEKAIRDIEKKFPSSIRFSEASRVTDAELFSKNVLIVDTVGHLSVLYQYGKIAYVGGAFGDGLHNILEPAVFGLPIIFGREFRKFQEAKDLIQLGGAFSIKNHKEAQEIVNKLITDNFFYEKTAEIVQNYVMKQLGATEKVWEILKES